MSYSFRTIDNIDVKGSVVIVRADLNVPMINGKVSDSSRIQAVAPTLLELSKKGSKVVILSHFGRPKGVVRTSMSLKPLLPHLSNALGGLKVTFAPDGTESGRMENGMGKLIFYHPNGRKRLEEFYVDSRLTRAITWDEGGKQIADLDFSPPSPPNPPNN